MDRSNAAVAIFDKCAQAYQDKFMDVGMYQDTFDVFCAHISNHDAAILDIACGPGNITKYLLSKRPDFKILGIDLAVNMVALAQANNPTAEFRVMDGRAIVALEKKYEGIMCGFCLPYLSKEEAVQLISDAARILSEDGVLYLSTMEDDYSKSGMKTASNGDELFVHYHEAGYLSEALHRQGFKIIDTQRKEYRGGDSWAVTDLVIIAVKHNIPA
jgi:predicted TPR repeat methyltransferase